CRTPRPRSRVSSSATAGTRCWGCRSPRTRRGSPPPRIEVRRRRCRIPSRAAVRRASPNASTPAGTGASLVTSRRSSGRTGTSGWFDRTSLRRRVVELLLDDGFVAAQEVLVVVGSEILDQLLAIALAFPPREEGAG